MGADGGSIPRRSEMVKTKGRAETADKDEVNLEKFNLCSLSMTPLKRPVVACRLGKLYNKEAVISYLLERKGAEEVQEAFSHIRGLKDVKELQLTDNPSFDGGKQAGSAMFICPVTGKEMNGNFRFFYYRSCGCVLSEQALKEVKQQERCCLKCGKEMEIDERVPIYGREEEVERIRVRLGEERKGKKPNKTTAKVTKRTVAAVTGEILALKRTKVIEELYTKN